MFTLQKFERALIECLPEATSGGLCVALSGGLDSTVLLVALATLRHRGAPLRAIHVDHGLHTDSARWAETCRSLAGHWSVPLDCVRVDIASGRGESPEAAAREARYDALFQRLQPGEVLLTAHHADDQLETVLLQWLRGGGLQSVAGMARIVRGGRDAWHARPLLEFTRDELLAWARDQRLSWLEDPSNADVRFDRNYLRLEVLPALRARWPAAARTIGRVAEYARDALVLEDTLAMQDLATIARGGTLSVQALLELPEPRQRAVLRRWLRGRGLPLPAADTLAALRHDMARAAGDRNPQVDWPGAVVRRYRGRLHAMSRGTAVLREGEWWIADSARFALGAEAWLERVPGLGVGLSRERLPTTLRVAKRSEGATFTPAGRTQRRPLRKWFQEHAVLPWRRDGVPLLYAGDELVAVGDLACGAPYAAQPAEPGWRIVWHGRGAVTESDALSLDWREDPPIR